MIEGPCGTFQHFPWRVRSTRLRKGIGSWPPNLKIERGPANYSLSAMAAIIKLPFGVFKLKNIYAVFECQIIELTDRGVELHDIAEHDLSATLNAIETADEDNSFVTVGDYMFRTSAVQSVLPIKNGYAIALVRAQYAMVCCLRSRNDAKFLCEELHQNCDDMICLNAYTAIRRNDLIAIIDRVPHYMYDDYGVGSVTELSIRYGTPSKLRMAGYVDDVQTRELCIELTQWLKAVHSKEWLEFGSRLYRVDNISSIARDPATLDYKINLIDMPHTLNKSWMYLHSEVADKFIEAYIKAVSV
jgi:hypothetical protein